MIDMKMQLKLLCLFMALALFLSGCYSVSPQMSSTEAASSSVSISEMTVSSESFASGSSSIAVSSSQTAASTTEAVSTAKPASMVAASSVAASSKASAAVSQTTVSAAVSALSPDSITAEQIVATLNGYFALDPTYSKLQKPYSMVPSCAYGLKFTINKNSGTFDAFDYRIDISNYTTLFKFIGTGLSSSVLQRETMLKELLSYIERQGRYLCDTYPGIRFSCSFYEPKMTNPGAATGSAEMNLFLLNVYRKGRYFTWQNFRVSSSLSQNAYQNAIIGPFHWDNTNDTALDIRSTHSDLVINGDDVSYKN